MMKPDEELGVDTAKEAQDSTEKTLQHDHHDLAVGIDRKALEHYQIPVHHYSHLTTTKCCFLSMTLVIIALVVATVVIISKGGDEEEISSDPDDTILGALEAFNATAAATKMAPTP